MNSKPLYKSKTFWANVLTAVVALGSGQLSFELPAEAAVVVVAIANVLLRLVTTEPVHIA